MYQVMIIDDEVAIHNLLRKTIDWESLQMRVVGTAFSGIEAINVIDEWLPDICFVDVEMPFMNGIEFATIANQRDHKMK